MAICKWCNQEMKDPNTTTCPSNRVTFPDGKIINAVPYGSSDWDGEEDIERRCHDCLVKWGGLHHPGCDMEECPRCGGQLISCGCLREDEESEDEKI